MSNQQGVTFVDCRNHTIELIEQYTSLGQILTLKEDTPELDVNHRIKLAWANSRKRYSSASKIKSLQPRRPPGTYVTETNSMEKMSHSEKDGKSHDDSKTLK